MPTHVATHNPSIADSVIDHTHFAVRRVVSRQSRRHSLVNPLAAIPLKTEILPQALLAGYAQQRDYPASPAA